jgi:hypothetical protein
MKYVLARRAHYNDDYSYFAAYDGDEAYDDADKARTEQLARERQNGSVTHEYRIFSAEAWNTIRTAVGR